MSNPALTPVWHILGAGSMGSLASQRLQRAGFSTRLAGSQTAASRRLTMPDGKQTLVSLDADDAGPIRALLLAVKAGDTTQALTPLLPRLSHDTLLLSMQNGMGTLDGLVLPDGLRVVHAVTTDGAWRDGNDIHVVAENLTWAGNGQPSPPPELRDMQTCWPGWQWCEDIDLRQWQKLVINALINPLTALFDCRNGELLDNGPRLSSMSALAAELDFLLPHWLPSWPGNSLSMAMEVAQQTASNTSSMRADVQAGRPTEVDYINGHVVRMAARHGLSARENQDIVARVRSLLD